MERLTVRTVAALFCVLRWLFLSSKTGALIHNFILYIIDGFFLPVRFGRKVPDIPEMNKMLRNGRWKNPATIGFIRKTYLLNSHIRERMLENLTTWRSVIGYRRRKNWEKRGCLVPSNIYLSPTYRCNLECKGCYALGHEGELSLKEIERITDEQELLGIFHILIFGGEPFLRKDLWQVYLNHPRTLFDIFTNGTLISEEDVEKIIFAGNIRLLISLEGLQETTNRRRGEGVYEKIVTSLELCQRKNIYYGVSVTVSKENFQEVTSEAFVEEMNRFGVHFISYVLYIPCGEDSDAFLAPSLDQVIEIDRWVEHLRANYPIFSMAGKNGSSLVTACSAADGRIHITADGDVEPCVFCHFAVDNIKDKSIIEAMESEFFQHIRLLNNSGASCFTPCKEKYFIISPKRFSRRRRSFDAKN